MTFPTLHITAEHVTSGQYTGPDVSDYPGHIEIAADLGQVIFAGRLRAKGRIRALAGCGIKAGEGIEAGLSISCKILSVRLRIFAGLCTWRLPAPGEQEIRAEVRSGTVAFGTVIAPTKAEG